MFVNITLFGYNSFITSERIYVFLLHSCTNNFNVCVQLVIAAVYCTDTKKHKLAISNAATIELFRTQLLLECNYFFICSMKRTPKSFHCTRCLSAAIYEASQYMHEFLALYGVECYCIQCHLM